MRLALGLLLLSYACRTMTPDEYMQVELSLLQAGVKLEHEEQAVRRVLRQRHLDVVDELRGAGFVALGAEGLDGRQSAVRVITPRGVVVAEDGARDDLFAADHVALLKGFGPSLGDKLLVGVTRTSKGADLGCLALFRVLPDGSAVPVVLDLSPLGSRACVASLEHTVERSLRAVIAWPGLTALATPHIEVQLSFDETLPGHAPARIPVVRIAPAGDWLDAQRAARDAATASGAFSERHGLGVARAALALLAGLDRETQLGLYSAAVGRLLPGSFEAETSAETAGHIGRGWVDPEQPDAPAGADEPLPDDAEIIEPGPSPNPGSP